MRTALGILLTALTCAACWTPQHAEVVWQQHALDRSRVEADAIDAVGISLTARSPGRGDDVVPRPGDVVVYAIDVETPDKRYRRYLRLTVKSLEVDAGTGVITLKRSVTITQTTSTGFERARRFSSKVYPVHLEMFDASGELVGESTADNALVELLAHGFHHSSESYLSLGEREPTQDEVFEIGMLDGPALFSIGTLVQSDPTLRDLAFDLMDTSLAWTVLWNFGVHLSIEPNFHSVERIAIEPVTTLPGYRFPVQFRLNGKSALRLAATVVEPLAPIGLTAGITRVDGFRSTDDRYRFRVRWIPPAE